MNIFGQMECFTGADESDSFVLPIVLIYQRARRRSWSARPQLNEKKRMGRAILIAAHQRFRRAISCLSAVLCNLASCVRCLSAETIAR